jgi:mannose-6-phosphate isomerase-like protein (cupin superfamily)
MQDNIEIISLDKKLLKINDLWTPKIVTELNDTYVKLVKVKGEYVWHKHDNEDELFFVIDGLLKQDLRKEAK